MTITYEKLQKNLIVCIKRTKQYYTIEKKKITNINGFLNFVKHYTNITKLDAEIIRTFIEKIYACNAETTDNKKIKKIIFNFIGKINSITKNKQKKGITIISIYVLF